MKRTLNIADPLLIEAEKQAARDGTTLLALVEKGLRVVVAQSPQQRIREDEPRRLRIEPFHGEGLTDEFKNAGWSRIRSVAYGLPDDE